jgi:stage II sporulation protein D
MSNKVKLRQLFSILVSAIVLLSAARSPMPAAASAADQPDQPHPTLRVGMWTLWHDRELTIAPSTSPAFTALITCKGCGPRQLLQATSVKADNNAIALTAAGQTLHVEALWLSGTTTLAAHGESVTLPYPIEIAARAGKLVIAVTMPIESYVERVVASESGPADTSESLKALAVVVRTFALHEAHGHPDYEVCDSTHCQLLHWGDIGTRRAAAHAATLATSGETLWFLGARALAYFNKDCGGHTASPAEIWPKAHATPYLPSAPDRFCSAGGSKEWASELTRNEISAALAQAGVAKPGWQQLTVERRGESGRAVTLRLDATLISAEDFQLAVGQVLGWNKLPSTWFEVSQQGDRFLFHGRGYGHGVGLCQKGSAAMAAAGRTSEQILAQYFPGAQPADEATGRTWRSFAGEGFTLESLDAADAAYLPDLNRARHEASDRSGLQDSASITVRAFPSTSAFRDATLAPGWVAAFTEGNFIATQPLHTLATRKLFSDTLLHEFLHALVETQANPNTPLWLREGLVETWTEAWTEVSPEKSSEPATKTPAPLTLTLEALDQALAHAKTEAASAAAHRAAGYFAAQLLKRFGRAQVLAWLHAGLPSGVVAVLGQR